MPEGSTTPSPPQTPLWRAVLTALLLGGLVGAALVFFATSTPPAQVIETLTPSGSTPEPKTPTTYSEEIPALRVSPTLPPRAQKITNLRTLSKGFDYRSELHFEPGETATVERNSSQSYEALYRLTIHEPRPATTLEDLSKAAPSLASQLPALSTLLESATVSPHWGQLYREKKKRSANHAHHLLKLLTKHNYYDCQTILNLRDPVTRRRALLVQADMDVVADGSDGDRLPTMPEQIVNSTHYQPTTSYGWEKVTKRPNPLIAGLKTRIAKANAEIAQSETSRERRNWLKARLKSLRATISELERRSYLIAQYDPFVVLPVPVIVNKSDPFAPNVGDYGLVFYQDRVFPVIVGDAGPDFKIGEASLRLAKEINAKASPYYRPVSDLSVTYLLFPGTRKSPHRAPDYDEIRQECLRLVAELGGMANPEHLHRWENTLPPLPPEAAPTPPPTQVDTSQTPSSVPPE